MVSETACSASMGSLAPGCAGLAVEPKLGSGGGGAIGGGPGGGAAGGGDAAAWRVDGDGACDSASPGRPDGPEGKAIAGGYRAAQEREIGHTSPGRRVGTTGACEAWRSEPSESPCRAGVRCEFRAFRSTWIDRSSTRRYGLPMPSISACEAKARFGELLKRVAGGESITITRHGTPVARIEPIAGQVSARRRAAIDRLRTFNRGQTLGGPSLRALIDDGRR